MYNLPWLMGGDFNEVLFAQERMGGSDQRQHSMGSFRQVVAECDLEDLGFKGHNFTWINGQEEDGLIQSRLDRFFRNPEWKSLFPDSSTTYLDSFGSDHRAVLTILEPRNISNGRRYSGVEAKRFKFEPLWLTHDDCKETVSEVWSRSIIGGSSGNLMEALENCAMKLDSWGEATFDNIPKQIKELQKSIREANKKDLHKRGAMKEIRTLEEKLNRLLDLEEISP